MLLDEPSNHLDLESLIWLEDFLKGYDGALLMTSHDREFMNRIVNKIVEIDGGALTTYSGNYDFYEQQRALDEKQQQAQFERQQAMLAKEIKPSSSASRRAPRHAAQVQSRVKKLDKIEQVEPPKRRQTVRVRVPARAALGRGRGQRSKNVHKALRQPHASTTGLDFLVRRRERWCVMGVNGAGKSTLLKLVAGATEPDDGTVDARRQRQDGLLRPARHGAARRRPHRVRDRWRIASRRPGRARCARSPAASASPATTSRSPAACCRAARRRAW